LEIHLLDRNSFVYVGEEMNLNHSFIVWVLISAFSEQALPEDYLPADISHEKLDEIFEHFDTDSDGRISYQEFRRALSLQDAIMTQFRPPES